MCVGVMVPRERSRGIFFDHTGNGDVDKRACAQAGMI